ncbi:MAG: glycosyltransferase [Muribaculaceae bacterium]|nr:glycosyltransferase [Muribaculaceae bacterium]
MTLQLLISTIDEGITQVAQMLLPAHPAVSYVVSWQHSGGGECTLPETLRRGDVEVLHLSGRGLSRNRNNALRHATADVCLIADDDCRYTIEGLLAVLRTFADDARLDLASFKMQNASEATKEYPLHSCSLRQVPRGYYPSSVEIAFRRQSVQGRLRFNENFGLGAPVFHCSEEEIFVHDALSLGLQCHFYPIIVVEHNHPTTDATRATRPGVLMAKWAYLYIHYRSKMLFYPFPIAWRLHKQHGVSFGYGLCYLFKGLFYILRHRRLATAGLISAETLS